MTKHKLDEEVEDILQHFGIKGMKWGIRRTDEQIAADDGAPAGGGGGEEEDEGLLEELSDKLKDTLDAMGKKLGSISKSMKKKGYNILEGIFGKSRNSTIKAKPDSRLTKQLIKQLKTYDKANPERKHAIRTGNDKVRNNLIRDMKNKR